MGRDSGNNIAQCPGMAAKDPDDVKDSRREAAWFVIRASSEAKPSPQQEPTHPAPSGAVRGSYVSRDSSLEMSATREVDDVERRAASPVGVAGFRGRRAASPVDGRETCSPSLVRVFEEG